MNKTPEQKWFDKQVSRYSSVQANYQQLGEVLRDILQQAANRLAPLAIVQTRAKTVDSFAGKIQRKRDKTPDPVMQFTDLCGGRVITQTQSQVRAISEFVKRYFEIDWDNSVDISQRHRPAEFGYRSVHYIIQLKPGDVLTSDLGVAIPQALLPREGQPMKAEIQIRTLLDHAWADFYHEQAYKPPFQVPMKIERDLAALAAILEDADRSFERIQSDLEAYARGSGRYLQRKDTEKEIERCKTILLSNADNSSVVLHQARLSMSLGEWRDAVDLLEPHKDSDNLTLVQACGVALCRTCREAPKGEEYREGQRCLQRVCDANNMNSTALAELAESWWPLDRNKASALWRMAFELDPSDPGLLVSFLCDQIIQQGNLSQVALMTPAIKAAIQRCRDCIDAGANLPAAWFQIGLLSLLLDRRHDSFHAYAKAIQISVSGHTLDDALDQLRRLTAVRAELLGYVWVERLLLLGLATRFQSEDALEEMRGLATEDCKPIQGPVVIAAGGCDSRVEGRMHEYRKLMLEAFQDFSGTVISGGTSAGISGLIGDVKANYPEHIHTLAYIPQKPRDVMIDAQGFPEIRRTDGDDFSVLEPLQNWIDLVVSAIDADQVKLIGINGGKISAAEYRIGLALGAKVAIIEGSGRDAAKLLRNDNWKDATNLLSMPADPATVRAFIGAGKSSLDDSVREAVARSVHEEYRRMQSDPDQSTDPSMVVWEKLGAGLKESNRQAADHISAKLRQIGCDMRPVKDQEIPIRIFSDKEVEIMAALEHGRWNVERFSDGWRYGEEKDVNKKISPYLVSWDELPEGVKDWDRGLVRKIPGYLSEVGLEVYRL